MHTRIECKDMLREESGRGFLTALLLTGSAERAESAVLEGICVWDAEEDAGLGLMGEIVRASIGKARARDAIEPAAAPLLPEGLRAVLSLAGEARRCYVLRVLEGWPAAICARFLGMDIREVNEYACEALRDFPALDVLAQENALLFQPGLRCQTFRGLP